MNAICQQVLLRRSSQSENYLFKLIKSHETFQFQCMVYTVSIYACSRFIFLSLFLSIYYYSRLICCILISVTFLSLQIPPAPIRVGEGEPPPSWDPVPTPKGTKLLVSLLLLLWIVYMHIINWLWPSMNYICLSLLFIYACHFLWCYVWKMYIYMSWLLTDI
jgi:hypothetical protein